MKKSDTKNGAHHRFNFPDSRIAPRTDGLDFGSEGGLKQIREMVADGFKSGLMSYKTPAAVEVVKTKPVRVDYDTRARRKLGLIALGLIAPA